MGAVVVAYNLPGVEQPIRFTPDLLADIYLGNIKRWNDPRLQAQNSTLNLPDQEIVVVHRADSSGTTFVWTDYLNKVSPLWAKQVGPAATSVKWPCGVAEKGNEGVSARIASTPGSLGYTELTYAIQNNLRMGLVQNREGQFVRPTLESVTAAAAGALGEIPDTLRYSLTNAMGKESYPIAGTVWAVVYTDQKGDRGEALVNFLSWVTHDGQKFCEPLQYASLPTGLVSRVEQKLAQIKVNR
jgi:phosphate transport system substrate-binding protein